MTTKKTYSGFNAETTKNLLLDAGAIYVNYDVSQSYDSQADKLLGATSGGNAFEAKPEFRDITVDGVKGKAKGLSILQSWEITLKTNLLEFKEDTYRYALGAVDVKPATVDDAEYSEIRAKNFVSDEDYLDNITFIGTISGSAEPVIIQVYNALNMEGLSIDNKDGEDIVAELTFTGHYSAAALDTPPFAIFYPKRSVVVEPGE